MTSVKTRVLGMGLALLLMGADIASAGFPWVSNKTKQEKEVEWAMRADDPIGTRRVYKYGKFWPPYHRPVGPEATMTHRFHAAHYWPHPYNLQDQAYVRELSRLHVESGWMTATTLYEYHFDPATHEINRSGRMKLHWILTHAPEQHCHVYVQAGGNVGTSNGRMDSARRVLASIAGPAAPPEVALRNADVLGRPANEIDRIRRAELESQPIPRIKYVPGGGAADPGA